MTFFTIFFPNIFSKYFGARPLPGRIRRISSAFNTCPIGRSLTKYSDLRRTLLASSDFCRLNPALPKEIQASFESIQSFFSHH